MATFVGKWVWHVAGHCKAVIDRIIVTESFIFANEYHHSRTFSRELKKVDNSRNFSLADYSRYTVLHYKVTVL